MSPSLLVDRLGRDVKMLMATYARVIHSDDDTATIVATLSVSAEDSLRAEAVS